MAKQSNIQWPWTTFYTNALNYMDSLHTETCQPQIKIAKFIVAVRHCFASPIMKPAKGKQPKKQSKIMVQNPSNSIKGITSNSDTDSAYSELPASDTSSETESYPGYRLLPEDIDTDTEPPFQDHSRCITRPSTNSHAQPSCIPIFQDKEHTKDSQLHASHKPTAHSDQTTQATTPRPSRTCPVPPPRPSKATNAKETRAKQYKQLTKIHLHPQPARKTPLLPTPLASVRQLNNRNHYRQFIPRPLPPRYNIHSTSSGPWTLNNNKYHQQPQIPAFSGPLQHAPGHTTQHTLTYLPVFLQYPNHLVGSLPYMYAV